MAEGSSGMRQWVWKYEVLARVDSGRNWFSLGTFEGNRDMTSEVEHKLPEPVECRYLRFRVLGYDRVAAMRVGVYGQRPQKRSDAAERPAADAEPARTAAAPTATEEWVKYRILYAEEGRTLNRMPLGFASALSRRP